MAERKLTPKQEVFVAEYLKTGNASEAARRAYPGQKDPERYSQQLLTKSRVAARVKEANRRRDERLELEEDFELKWAIRLLEMCAKPEQKVDMQGNPVTDEAGNFVMGFDSKGANTALQTIAKLRGKFTKKVELGVADDIAAQLARIK